ncbi:MAG: glycosyltransferase family 4 protein [Geobacteraceae bacterium]|nr:glycosyltransferase family 4 protein [Geobacteraceae bacterium]
MKIALIRQKYTPFGGAERYMARLVEGLAAAGHRVHILAAQWDTDGTQAVTLHRVPVIGKPGWLKALTFSRGCRSIIEREHFDVVFSLERTLRQDIYRAGDGCHRQWLILKNQGKGLLHKAWTWLNPLQLAYVWLERRMFTDPDLKAIIANSRRGKEEIVRLYGVDPNRIHVVYNGIDPVSADQDSKSGYRRAMAEEFGPGDELRLLYVGSGFKRKGVAAAIRAAARLSVPFRLFIVGKGKAAFYRGLAKRLGIHDRVIFTGPRKDVEQFYQGCDLFVFPTLYDPFSNATLEAMAHGLPVITSAFNGVAELIRDGVNGYVVQEPLDDAAISECMRALTDADRRRQMGELAAETAAPFTMQRNIQETLDVIRKVSPPGVEAFNCTNPAS